MNLAFLRGSATAIVIGFALSAGAQQNPEASTGTGQLPMLFSTSPHPPDKAAPSPQQFELPSTFPAIPSGAAIIPPSDGQGQRPGGQTGSVAPAPPPAAVTVMPSAGPGLAATGAPVPLQPLPTTTPLPPADVAAPLVPPGVQPTPAQTPAAPASQAAAPSSAAPPSTTVRPSQLPPPSPAPAPQAVQAPTNRPDVIVPPIQPSPPAYPVYLGAADGRGQIIRLRDMGLRNGLHLEGTAAEASVPFSARQDDAFVGSRLSLMFSYSGAVARDDGELSVYLNNEPIGSVALGRTRGPKSRVEFTFSPALLTTDNRLQFRFALKGQGANACKVARDRAFWVNIEPSSFIYLNATRLPMANDLAFLPRPFVDPKDALPLTLPFVLPAGPEPGVLEAAGMVAGYFGLIAQYKGATFPVQYQGLPATNAVVLVQGDRYPPGVASVPGEGPRVAMVTNPAQVDSKLLLVIGANAAELRAAAATLAVGAARLAGEWTRAHEALPPPRKPYDAPKWISTDHPVRLGDLAGPSNLTGRRIADSPEVSFRTAPDLFFGAQSGGMLHLRLHRAEDSWIDAGDSRVIIDLNRRAIDEVPMEPKLKVLSRLKEWLFPGKADDRVSHVILPGYQLFSANRLDFVFDLRARQSADCASLEWSDRTGVDPDSLIDLTQIAHFAAFPNLALFANSGFPFTRLADLSDTAFVMPDAPSAEEAQAFLNLLGTFANDTGVPAARYTVVTADHLDSVADRNLIVIGLRSSQPLLGRWEAYNSVHITATGASAVPGPDFLERLFQPYDPRAPYYRGAAVELAKADLGKPYAYLSSFWSPLDNNRLVVMVGATEAAALVELTGQLVDSEQTSNIQGDFFLFTNGKGEFYTSGWRKFVGDLPIWWEVEWLAGSYSLAAFICVICAILLLAIAIQRFAAHRAGRLLAHTISGRRARSTEVGGR